MRHIGKSSIRSLLVGLLGLLLLALPNFLAAQSWYEQLVMPGDLIEGHAKLESVCANCHKSFSKDAQRGLCLDCHKDVSADFKSATGFHGRNPEVGARECSHCHTDHIGRTADILLLDEETFDHNFTDFILRSSHQGTSCSSCHANNEKPRLASTRCFGCHEKDDRHRGQLGKECADCHQETDWSAVTAFDHSSTEFKLVDAHQKLRCQSCHVGEVYKDLPKLCVDCHLIQDVHEGRLGQKCESCHKPAKWKEVRFNHGQDTDFALIGKHTELECNACHTGELALEKPRGTCADCHKADDVHKGQLGARCGTCHSAEGWRAKVVFDHDITAFPLIGLHAVVPCESCHETAAFKKTTTKCADCHKDGFHNGRLGDTCANCHNPNGWAHWEFNHDSETDFRLTGSHAGLNCHACHSSQSGLSPKPPQSCVGCHAANDKHKGRFGRQCSRCHSSTKFTPARLR
ncbi:MAG: cytochrome C [Rhodobacteraceae bacterium]|nr:cytochrome C [Paracoccaceae bacterium]